MLRHHLSQTNLKSAESAQENRIHRELGKAIINPCRRPAATGCDFFSRLNLSADMGRQASGVRSQEAVGIHGSIALFVMNTYDWMRDDGVAVAKHCKSNVRAG